MSSIILFAEIRAEWLKAKLCSLARTKEAVIVRLREGPILAYRIFCRDRIAVLIDRFGYQTQLGYDDIVDATPANSPVSKSPVSKSPVGTSPVSTSPAGKPIAGIACRTGWRPAGANNPRAELCSNNVIAFRRPEKTN
jgi:hypothetical protein